MTQWHRLLCFVTTASEMNGCICCKVSHSCVLHHKWLRNLLEWLAVMWHPMFSNASKNVIFTSAADNHTHTCFNNGEIKPPMFVNEEEVQYERGDVPSSRVRFCQVHTIHHDSWCHALGVCLLASKCIISLIYTTWESTLGQVHFACQVDYITCNRIDMVLCCGLCEWDLEEETGFGNCLYAYYFLDSDKYLGNLEHIP